MFAFQSNQSCKINCVTWSKDAHALFDYESEEITKNIYTLGKGGKIFLNEEKGTTNYEPDNQEDGFFLTGGHSSSSEGCLINFFNEYGAHTRVTKKIKDEYEYNKENITEIQNMIYYVISQKELKGSDLLKLSGSQNILIEKNHISQMDLAHSFNNDINKKININNNNNDIQLEFLKDIRQQSNEYNNIDFKKPNNNMMLSQRMDMKHDFNEINEDNKLARTQFINGTDYFNNINKKMNNNSNKKQTNKISNKIKNPEESKDIIYKSQQVFYNNNFNSSINEQSNLNNNNNFLGKSQQNLGYRNKK